MAQHALPSAGLPEKFDLKSSMRLTTKLLREGVEQIEHAAAEGAPRWRIERQIQGLLRYELQSRQVRLGVIIAAMKQLAVEQPGSDNCK